MVIVVERKDRLETCWEIELIDLSVIGWICWIREWLKLQLGEYSRKKKSHPKWTITYQGTLLGTRKTASLRTFVCGVVASREHLDVSGMILKHLFGLGVSLICSTLYTYHTLLSPVMYLSYINFHTLPVNVHQCSAVYICSLGNYLFYLMDDILDIVRCLFFCSWDNFFEWV